MNYHELTMHILGFLAIIAWCIFLSLKFPKYSWIMPAFTVSLFVIVLYIGALGSQLLITTAALTASSPFVLIFSLLTLWKNPKKINFLLPTLLFFVIGMYWYVYTFSATLFGWDEFVWAGLTKAIFNSHQLYTAASAVVKTVSVYPPAIPLFQYYFQSFGGFKESILYFAQGILIFPSFIVFLSGLKTWWQSFLMMALMLFGVYFFGPGLLSLMADHVLGLVFASTLGATLLLFKTPQSKLLLIPMLAFLSLTKVTGILLVAVTIVVVLAEFFLKKWVQTKNVLIALTLVFTPIMAVFSWRVFLSTQQQLVVNDAAYQHVTQSISPHSIIKTITSGKLTARESQVLSNYPKAIYSLPFNNSFFSPLHLAKPLEGLLNTPIVSSFTILNSVGGWVLIMLLGFWCVTESKQQKQLGLVMFGGLLFYLAFYLLVYMYLFTDYEASVLASYARYMKTYFIALFFITSYLGIKNIALLSRNHFKLFLAISIYFVVISVLYTPPVTSLLHPPADLARNISLDRSRVRVLSSDINSLVPKDKKIWFIYQNSLGIEPLILRYEIAPRRMNDDKWSLGELYSEGDIATKNLTADQWKLLLTSGNYDYVYLAYADSNFWDRFSDMFIDKDKVRNHKLFSVERIGSTISLRAYSPSSTL